MKAMRTFLYVLRRSFTDPSYYKELTKTPFSFSLKFFLAFFFLYALVATTIIAKNIIPPLDTFTKAMLGGVDRLYPPELVITIRKGEVTTNVSEPYVVPLSVLKSLFGDELPDNPKNLLVIDTKGTVDSFADYKTVALLTKRTLIARGEDSNWRVYPLSNVSDITIDQTLVRGLSEKVKPFLSMVIPLVILAIFAGISISVPVVTLLYILLIALIVMAIARLLKKTFTYKKGYQLGMHFVLLPTTAVDTLTYFGVTIPIPFFHLILVILVAWVVVRALPRGKS